MTALLSETPAQAIRVAHTEHIAPEPESRFNLAGLIREHVTTSEETDPQAIADEVFDAIDPALYGDALRSCLRQSVRRAFGAQRREAFEKARAQEQRQRDTADEDGDLDRVTDKGIERTPLNGGSAKVAGIRQVRALLEMRIHVGNDVHKHFADCTTEDLRSAAGFMRAQASVHARRAQVYDNVAVLLGRHKVSHVRDLPGQELLQVTRS